MRPLLIFLFIFFSASAYADLYKTVGPDGSISYSDVPSKGAVEFTPPPINEVPTTLPPKTQSGQSVMPSESQNDMGANANYTAFAIQSPTDQATIQNQPEFPVELKVEPSLQAGDKIQLVLDGQPVGSPEASTRITISNVNRGTHQLSAILLDRGNKIIKRTASITIFVHRASILNNTGARLTPSKKLTYPIQSLFYKAKDLLFPG